MFSDRLVRSLAGWGLLVLLGGCSVREDRSDCPCLLVVDLSGLDAAGWVQAGYTSVSWSVRSDGFRIEGCLPLEGLPPELVVEIPRGAAQLTLLSGADDLCGPDGSLVIPEGEACPPLLAFSAAVDAALPEVTVPVTLHKRYARVDILSGTICRMGILSPFWARPAVMTQSCGLSPVRSGSACSRMRKDFAACRFRPRRTDPCPSASIVSGRWNGSSVWGSISWTAGMTGKRKTWRISRWRLTLSGRRPG